MVALFGSTKRQDILLEAMVKLEHNVKLLLVGDGPNRELLENKVVQLGIEDRVFFLGWIMDPSEVYLFADIVVFVSDQEGLPYSVSEAMSYKIPIIASSVGGVPEQIIDNKGVMLIQNNNVDEMVEKINKLIDSDQLKNDFISYSFSRVQDMFSTDIMNDTILKLYKKSN